ncbi:MAG: hypothetical protein OXD54_16400 [Candidatus Poribacteria bacterium]|nr:hypothetical protein [Candidatus Poribacteria bacterium]
MDILPPDYDKVEKELWIKHRSEVRELLANQDPGLLRRIRTFCNRFGHEEAEVCDKINDDLMFSHCFAKDAGKTGFHQKEAAKYLCKFPHIIRDFKTLKASGKKARYIDQTGNIITGKKPTGIKSLDFTWIVGNTHIRCFAAHKVTREAGGAQDNQRNELINLLQMFKHNNNKKIAFFAICDGAYYDQRTLSMLREHVRNEPPYSFACPVGDVPHNVRNLLADLGN